MSENSSNYGKAGTSASTPKISREDLHKNMQASLAASSKTQSRKPAGNKSVSQLSQKQNSRKRKSSAPVQESAAPDAKAEKMRRIKESMNSMERSSSGKTTRSSAASEAEKYVKRQNGQGRHRSDSSSGYDKPGSYRQKKEYQGSQVAAEKKSMKWIIAVFAVVILLAAAYFLGVIMCSKGFLPNTYMNDVDISGMSMDEAKAAVIDAVEVKGLTFTTRDGDEVHFEGSEFGSAITMEDESQFDEAASQSVFLWFKNYLSKAKYKTKLINTYDENELAELVEGYKWGSAPPTDAYLQKQDDGTYIIIPEDNGDMVDTDILSEYTLELVRSGKTTIDMTQCDCYLKAKVTEESLQPALEEANSLQGLQITYDFDDRQEVLDSQTIVEWVSSDANGDISVDEDAVRSWVQANIADKYDTFVEGYTRSFKSTMQGVVDIPLGSEGIYGWLTDVDATTNELVDLILEGKSIITEPVYQKKGNCRASNDIGDTYIEVDITNQHVWYYENGKLIMDSDCVTGMANDPSRATPTGVFQLWSMERDVVLQGADYAAPVSFWMYISECGVGLHDYARGAYGGDIYQYAGSHGCINLPWDFAEALFNACDTGIPVLIIP